LSLFSELKRRNVFRVSVAYIVSAWLLAQVADLVLDAIGAPEWVMQSILLVLALGLAPVVFFSWAYEVTPEGIKRESEVDRNRSITHVTGRKLDRTITFVLVLAVAYFAVDKFVIAPSSVTPAADAVATTGTEVTDTELAPTIAVLPFVNMSDDEANEYFSDGLSEELLNVLARNPALQVAARTSSFSLKGEKLSIEEVARRLNVAHVLEGSVRKAGDQVRITAQLIRADNGYHLWSDTYDRNLDNIFAVQDEIADKITAALLPRIMGEGSQAAPIAYTPPAEAYQDYLLARNHFNKLTVVDMETAYEILQGLVREHPEYAEAQALFARVTYANSRRTGGDIPWIVAEQQVRRALEQASAGNPDLPEIYLVEGLLHARSHDPHTAIEFYEKAIELNPSYAEAWRYLSEAADDSGQEDQAWEALEMARKLDPISVSTLSWVVRQANDKNKPEMAAEAMRVLTLVAPETADDLHMHVLHEQRRIAEAAIAAEDFRAKWPDADPHDEHLARLFARMGLVEEAIDLDPGLRPFLLAESGQRDHALAAMEEEARNRTDPHDRADAYWITYLTLDMKNEALEVLSDLWYGYAAEDMGPRMDFTDVFTFVQLLRAADRHEEAEPIARMFVESESSGSVEPNPYVLMTAGDNDAAMARFLDLAERGEFPAWSSRLRSTIFALESHPDYPRLEAMFDAWQEEQRVLYDELTAARASPDDVAHP
jgi:TolB-like protein